MCQYPLLNTWGKWCQSILFIHPGAMQALWGCVSFETNIPSRGYEPENGALALWFQGYNFLLFSFSSLSLSNCYTLLIKHYSKLLLSHWLLSQEKNHDVCQMQRLWGEQRLQSGYRQDVWDTPIFTPLRRVHDKTRRKNCRLGKTKSSRQMNVSILICLSTIGIYAQISLS